MASAAGSTADGSINRSRRTLPRAWPLLFPLTYLLHVLEEYYCGERFFYWATRLSGIQLTAKTFLQINKFGLIVVFLLALLVVMIPALRWLMIPLATVVLINGSAHTLGSILSFSYSPGLVTGLLLWVPLGLVTLRRTRPTVSAAQFWALTIVGLLLHGLVVMAVVMNR